MISGKLAKVILNAALDVKAEDPAILDLRKLTSFTDYFVIVGASSDRQVQAIADRIIESLNDQGIKPLGKSGRPWRNRTGASRNSFERQARLRVRSLGNRSVRHRLREEFT